MNSNIVRTREISPLPRFADDSHKGDMGRLIIVGGCFDGDVAMIGAPALAANAAFRAGIGLVQVMVPGALRGAVASLAPCATFRSLPSTAADILAAVVEFHADAVAIGPGLGNSLEAREVHELLHAVKCPTVVDADALNALAALPSDTAEPPDIQKNAAPSSALFSSQKLVFTPHPGEAQRLLAARGISRTVGTSSADRQSAAYALVNCYGGTFVLKGMSTIVTDGKRMYVNETGNSGMATAGTGDVLTGIIAVFCAQGMAPLEAAIAGVYLHGLAGDFAAEEIGRRSMTALDVLDFLPEAILEHEQAESD